MIEVVITIAIMGILMAAAMPSVGDWMRSARVRNTAESIQNGLQQARMEAVRRNRPVSFNLVSSLDNTCTLSATSGNWIVSADANPAGQCGATPSTTTAPKVVAKAAMADGGQATISPPNSGTPAPTVTLNGLRMVANATAITRIALSASDGSYPRRVEISSGGIARLCDPGATAGDTRACTQ